MKKPEAIAVSPSVEAVRMFVLRAMEMAGQNTVLFLVPGGLMRREVESLVLEKGPVAGNIEVATLNGLASRIARKNQGSAAETMAYAVARLSASGDQSPGTLLKEAADLVRLFAALRHSGVQPAQVRNVAEIAPKTPARYLRLYEKYLSDIQNGVTIDDVAVLDAACDALDELGPAALGSVDVFWLGFYSVTPAQANFLKSLSKASRSFKALVEVAPVELELAGGTLRNDPVFRELAEALDISTADLPPRDSPPDLRWAEFQDPMAEAESALQWCQEMMASGVAPSSIAVVVPTSTSLMLFSRTFTKAGVPFFVFGMTKGNVHSAALLRKAAQLAMEMDPVELRVAVDNPSFPLEPGSSRRAIRYLLKKAKLWSLPQSLEAWRTAVRAAFEQAGLHSRDGKTVRDGDERFELSELEASSRSLCDFLVLLGYLGVSEENASPDSLSQLVTVLAPGTYRGPEADEFAKTAYALAKLPAMSLPLAVLIALDLLPAKQPDYTDGIALCTILSARQLIRTHLFIAGLDEESYPFRREFISLPPQQTQALRLHIIDRLEESRHLYFLLTRRATSAVLSFASRKGTTHLIPSFYWYLEYDGNNPAKRFSLSDSASISSDLLSSFLAAPWLSREGKEIALKLIAENPSLGVGVRGGRAVAMRYGTILSRFSGGLDIGEPQVKAAIDELFERWNNVTHMERFASCPLQFFFGRIIGLDPLPDEEEELLSHREFGTVLHDLLSCFYSAFKQAFPGKKVSEEFERAEQMMLGIVKRKVSELEEAGADGYLIQRIKEWCQGDVLSGIPSAFVRYEKEKDLDAPLEVEADIRARFPDSDGGWKLKGRIDRLQVIGCRTVVIDYKSGAMPGPKNIKSGMDMQLPVYCLALAYSRGSADYAFNHYSLKLRSFGLKKYQKEEEFITLSKVYARETLNNLANSARNGIFNRDTQDPSVGNRCPYAAMCGLICKNPAGIDPGKTVPKGCFVRIDVGREEE
ncbi:MAG: hypothetical protein Kow00107_02530 [Planctomycetota bacterium]